MTEETLEITKVTIRGVVWYDLQIPLGGRTVIVKRLTEEQVKRLRDEANGALSDVE